MPNLAVLSQSLIRFFANELHLSLGSILSIALDFTRARENIVENSAKSMRISLCLRAIDENSTFKLTILSLCFRAGNTASLIQHF